MMTMVFIEEKLRSRIAELKGLRYKKPLVLGEWQVLEDQTKSEKYPPEDFSKSKKVRLGEHWSGRDYYLWIYREIEIPQYTQPLFLFDFGKTGGGYNSGFEALLFLNGKPYQGVDSNHQEAFIDKELIGKKAAVCLKLWSGLEGGGPEQIQTHEFRQAAIVELDEQTDDLYYFSDMLLKTVNELSENDPVRYTLLDRLNQSFLKIDWSQAGSELFYQSTASAAAFLREEIEKLDKQAQVTVTAIGHTHIDVAWLWRLKHTREKAARSFSTVLRLMEQYPDYVFLQTQPQLYQYIKEDYPEIYEKIKARIKEGRWEVDGGMWLEADCNIPSGESLTRQLLHGSRFIKEEFDCEVHYLWLPDVFGYSWALPQILKKSGIATFMTTKISWNQFNRMPHDTFIWKGIDGSEVLTHFITTPEPKPHEGWASEWFYTYNGQLEPETVAGIYNSYRDKDFNQELLLSYGYGDGGGGVTRDMLEKRRRMDQLPGLPEVKTGRAADYFERLHKSVEETTHYIHKWDGELYLEYHRGTYTSQAFVKKMNRRTELQLRELEILYSLGEMKGSESYPQEVLHEMWTILLRNQFHDIIPGSSIKEVYQDHKEEFAQLERMLHRLWEELRRNTAEICLFNTAGWQRTTLVSLPWSESGYYCDEAGQMLPAVQEGDSALLLVNDIPAFSTKKIIFVKGQPEESRIKTGVPLTNGLETSYYIVEWNAEGQLIRLFDKENQREVLAGNGNVFQLFEDKPMNFDAWDIDFYYQEKGRELSLAELSISKNNALYVELEGHCEFGSSSLKQRIRLYRHTRRIDFLTEVNWQERQQLLKVKFDAAVRSTTATYDIQYGNVQRPTHWNTSWDQAKFETVGHQWADLSEYGYGVSLLNDSKYGYDIKENTLRLTLLKGGIYPDPGADIGQHRFTYSLLPHKGDFIAGKTVEEAWEINQSVANLPLDSSLSPVTLEEGEPVVIDALKKAEDGVGWILRIHEHTGGRKKVVFSLAAGFSWNEADLMERDLAPAQSNRLNLTLNPYEIKTIRIVKA